VCGGILMNVSLAEMLKNDFDLNEETLVDDIKVLRVQYLKKSNKLRVIIKSFEDIDEASNVVMEVLRSGVSPLAVEYQDKKLNIESAKALGLKWPLVKGNADLMIILSDKSEDLLYQSCEKINNIFNKAR